MTYTYDHSTQPNIALVRMRIGDQIQSAGVLPGGANYSDEEINVILTLKDDNVDLVAYYFLVALANTWSRVTDIAVGPRRESFSKVAELFRKQAESLGATLGIDSKAFAVGFKRVDGYSEAAE